MARKAKAAKKKALAQSTVDLQIAATSKRMKLGIVLAFMVVAASIFFGLRPQQERLTALEAQVAVEQGNVDALADEVAGVRSGSDTSLQARYARAVELNQLLPTELNSIDALITFTQMLPTGVQLRDITPGAETVDEASGLAVIPFDVAIGGDATGLRTWLEDVQSHDEMFVTVTAARLSLSPDSDQWALTATLKLWYSPEGGLFGQGEASEGDADPDAPTPPVAPTDPAAPAEPAAP